MSKVLRPREIAETVETILCDPKRLGLDWGNEEDSPRLVNFLNGLTDLICTQFGGKVVSVSGPEYSGAQAREAGIVPDDCETEWCVHVQGDCFTSPQDHWTRAQGHDPDGDLCPWDDEDQNEMNLSFGYGLYAGKGVPVEIEPWAGDPGHRFVEDAQETVWKTFWKNLQQEEAMGGTHWVALRHLQEENPLEVYYLREHCLKVGLLDIPQLAEWLKKHNVHPREGGLDA